jgi:hypothetical protein
MKLNDFVDKIYCINLDKRTDRWEKCESIFKHNNIKVDRFSAIDGSKMEYENKKLLPGEIGVIRSNLEIVKIAKKNNYKNVLIFEDDVELCENFNIKFNEYIGQIPNDWSFIYLGGNHVGGYNHVTDNVAKTNYSFAIHAIIINQNVYDQILQILPEEKEQVDVTYAKLQKIFPSYVFRPHLAWQRKDFSDIQGGVVDYDFLKK